MSIRKSIPAFTIVELLIVIVVIAILAAISVVAYNGIQTRANNAQTITAVKDYVKIYTSYAAVNGGYPGANSNYCLGEGYPANECWDNRTYTTNGTVITALKTISSSLPNPSTQRIYRNSTDGSRAGILFVGGGARDLRYQLQGADTQCGLDGATRTFTSGQSSGPECNIILPNPVSL